MFGSERDAAGCFDRMRASMRAENAAAGERLLAISELDLMVLRKFGARAESRARYVTAERCRNRAARRARQAAVFGPTLPRSDPDDDPPPF